MRYPFRPLLSTLRDAESSSSALPLFLYESKDRRVISFGSDVAVIAYSTGLHNENPSDNRFWAAGPISSLCTV